MPNITVSSSPKPLKIAVLDDTKKAVTDVKPAVEVDGKTTDTAGTAALSGAHHPEENCCGCIVM